MIDQKRRGQSCGTLILLTAILVTTVFHAADAVQADETFVTIHRVTGNQVAVVKSDAGDGRGMRGGAGAAAARGKRGGVTAQPSMLTVPADVKITSAMRERRTFEFRVGAELAGGLQHRVFRDMQEPLAARIVTDGGRITEINVIIPETEINQSGTDSRGQTVIAVRPKRPPMKKK